MLFENCCNGYVLVTDLHKYIHIFFLNGSNLHGWLLGGFLGMLII